MDQAFFSLLDLAKVKTLMDLWGFNIDDLTEEELRDQAYQIYLKQKEILKDLEEADLFMKGYFPEDKLTKNSLKYLQEYNLVNLEDLPDYLLNKLFKRLNFKDLKALSNVSKRFSTSSQELIKKISTDLMIQARELEKRITTKPNEFYIIDRNNQTNRFIFMNNNQLSRVHVQSRSNDGALEIKYYNDRLYILEANGDLLIQGVISSKSVKLLNSEDPNSKLRSGQIGGNPVEYLTFSDQDNFVWHEAIVKFTNSYMLTETGKLYEYNIPRQNNFKLVAENIANFVYTETNYLITLNFDGQVKVQTNEGKFLKVLPNVKDIIHIYSEFLYIFAVTQLGQIIIWSYKNNSPQEEYDFYTEWSKSDTNYLAISGEGIPDHGTDFRLTVLQDRQVELVWVTEDRKQITQIIEDLLV